MNANHRSILAVSLLMMMAVVLPLHAQDWWKPYSAPCVEREDVFDFAKKLAVKLVAKDKYEITFATEGYCDVTVGIVDGKGVVVRHLASGVLGKNAPAPFKKDSLAQTIYWDGKDDLRSYAKDPGKLKVRVSLGLRPAFDKLLGWSPHDMVGEYRGVVAHRDGVFVVSSRKNHAMSGGHPQLRKYDHDGNYVRTLIPPPGDIPVEKFAGYEKLEYEPGKWAIHSSVGHAGFRGTIDGYGTFTPGGILPPQQPCILDDTFLFTNGGLYTYYSSGASRDKAPLWSLCRVRLKDGTAPAGGVKWRTIKTRLRYQRFKLAVSPDEKWIYLAGPVHGYGRPVSDCAVHRLDVRQEKPLELFLGEEGKPGHDEGKLNDVKGLACDAAGRVYVCDYMNNRIQVCDPSGKVVKIIKISLPLLVQVDRKRGGIYVYHEHRDVGSGANKLRLAKLKSFDEPVVAAAFNPETVRTPREQVLSPVSKWEPHLAVDEWVTPVRVWLTHGKSHLVVLEDRGDSFGIFRDFREDVRKAGLRDGMMHCRFSKVTADPTREHVYFTGHNPRKRTRDGRAMVRYDLATGKFEDIVVPLPSDFGPDFAFDKRGFLLARTTGNVWRFDPERMQKVDRDERMAEVPFDYGTGGESSGAVALRDQGCAKSFQDGFGATMQGDVAVASNIGYVPKFDDVARNYVHGGFSYKSGNSYENILARMKARIKKGEELYSVRRWPGRLLAGGTVWVYDKTGELRSEDLVPGLGLVNGLTLDEQGDLYVGFRSVKLVGGAPFLFGRGRVIGSNAKTTHPFTGTLMKVPASGAQVLRRNAPIPLEDIPTRPPDLANVSGHSYRGDAYSWKKGGAWSENARWLYAGISPIVAADCSCPNMRHYTDWYRRTYVPEAYRHSVGILDANGNLLMHLGRHGNADSREEIAFAHVHYVTATDNCLIVSDAGNERLVVVKLDYHARAAAPIPGN